MEIEGRWKVESWSHGVVSLQTGLILLLWVMTLACPRHLAAPLSINNYNQEELIEFSYGSLIVAIGYWSYSRPPKTGGKKIIIS